MYDVAIIGTGPAAVSAAINLKIHNKNIIMFGTKELSKKVQKSEQIINYPGITTINGAALNDRFMEHLTSMDINITEQMVTNINQMSDNFMLLGGNDVYDAKSILLCVGATSAKGFSGEDELLGKGVSYCATCDGFLYRNKKIAVFVGDKKYEHEVK
ncbi:MAG: FAD-dependent oxidoreductase, partial [Lachnospiraceae bacterium]|nr:FAD-dependent oxidoreductase [Lachnospiraceae bacterium]